MIEVTNEDLIAASTEAAEGPVKETQFNLHIFTNDKSNPFLVKQLEMFYQCVLASKVGLMHAKNVETGKIETLLVGVEPTDGGLITYPLAKILDDSDMNSYLPPDGEGGYLQDVTEETTVN